MKCKSLLLTAVFSFALTPLAMAESAEDLFYQGVNAYKQGNYTQAAKLSEQACNGGYAQGCGALGQLYDSGQGVKQNYAQAAKLYEKACHGGVVQGCLGLGVLYHNGQGVKQNYAQAAQLYEQACNGGYAKGCYNLGVLYDNGQGKRQDLSSAKEYYGKACNLGYQNGCYEYKKLNIKRILKNALWGVFVLAFYCSGCLKFKPCQK